MAFASLGYASGAFESLQIDLADLDAVSAVARTPQVREADVVVFLAALATPTTLDAIDPAALTAAMNVGALANYVIMGAAGPGMASRGWGRIVVASSIGVKFGGGTDSFNYALANHASALFARLVVSQFMTGEECGDDGWCGVHGGGDPRVRS